MNSYLQLSDYDSLCVCYWLLSLGDSTSFEEESSTSDLLPIFLNLPSLSSRGCGPSMMSMCSTNNVAKNNATAPLLQRWTDDVFLRSVEVFRQYHKLKKGDNVLITCHKSCASQKSATRHDLLRSRDCAGVKVLFVVSNRVKNTSAATQHAMVPMPK